MYTEWGLYASETKLSIIILVLYSVIKKVISSMIYVDFMTKQY